MQKKYLLDLFTPFTWNRFREHGADVSGFKERQHTLASERGKPGTIFLCYLVRVSRWCGALEITSECFVDNTPVFQDENDPYVVRFRVRPLVILPLEHAPPMTAPEVWNNLTLTKGVELGSFGWAQSIGFRASLREIPPADGAYLLDLLRRQEVDPKRYPLTKDDERKLRERAVVKTERGDVEVEVPDRDEDLSEPGVGLETDTKVLRISIQKQSAVATIGAMMGFNIWIPAADRAAVE